MTNRRAADIAETPHAHPLSTRACVVHESTTLAIAAEAKRMQAAGVDVISLSTGEPDFPSPDIVKRAAIAAIENDFTHYTQSSGIPELRQAAAEKFERDNGIHATAETVLVSCGGKQSIYNALLAICSEDDEVLVPAPYWVSYPEMVRLVGARPVVLASGLDQSYKVTTTQIRSAATSRTRALFLNSPSNPSGAMYTRAELQEIAEVVAELGLYVISDELYEKIVFDGNRHVSIGSLEPARDLAITVNGVSKAFAMTGWRIGYMTGPREVIDAAGVFQSQITSNPTSISQKAALAALTGAAADVERMVETFARRRELTSRLLEEIPSVRFRRPDGAFYVLLDVTAYYCERAADSAGMAEYLLKEHHVAVVPGGAFGDDASIRISFACSDDAIEKGIARIAHGLDALGRR